MSLLSRNLAVLTFLARVVAAQELAVAVSPQEIRCQWPPGGPENIGLRESPLHTGGNSEVKELWRGGSASGHAVVPRFDSTRDRLYSKFELFDAANGMSLGPPQCVTDFSALPRRTHSLGSLATKKGVTCILDVANVVALGTGQVAENIDLGGLLDWQSAEPALSFDFEGRRVGLHPAAVAHLDAKLKALHAAKLRVTGILLNYVQANTPRTSPLVHPLTDPATVPAGPAAFNTATADGLFHYRALLHWLVERYTREDAAFGHLAGLVIGNEVQSHWTWYHLGHVEPEVLLREYSVALRVADLATRSVHADFPIYVSLEHHWTMPASDDPTMGISGVEVLEGVSERARREGDFPWHLAFHPYPENLFDPAFWRDHSAPLRLDAPRLTFHNLEVLPAFLREPQFLFAGKPRRIALTEQGFHCAETPDGEALQAAAFALAWKKVQAIPEIESFLYHRHVDHPHEFGLHCGLLAHDGSSNIVGIGRARKIWDVMQKAGTADEDAAFAFALPIIGRTDWRDVLATKLDPPKPVRRETGRVVFDFVAQRKAAAQENLQSLEVRHIGPADEVSQVAMQEHPKPQGAGRLTYRVAIPAAPAGLRCLLIFDALLNHPQSKGAGFAVEVDGREVFARKLTGGERVPAEVDLAPWAGREAAVVFAVDALADPAYDWATWVAPRIVLR